MDLYLDSVDFKEIERAFEFGFVKGLTTTPTFMHRHGITDIDGAIVKLSGMVPELQVEALGDTVDSILAEADRILQLPLEKEPARGALSRESEQANGQPDLGRTRPRKRAGPGARHDGSAGVTDRRLRSTP